MWPAPESSPATARSPSTRPRSGTRSRVRCHRKGFEHMTISPLAGKPAPKEMLVDLARLEREYFERKPDLERSQSIGQLRHQRASRLAAATARSPKPTSSPSRRPSATTGAPRAPMARSTWARTRTRFRAGPAHGAGSPGGQRGARRSSSATTAFTPTPVISRAILVYNRGRAEHLADGIVITPSHNPPEDGGFKYNPTNGGPADTDVTQWVQNRANELAAERQRRSEARAFATAFNAETTHQEDFVLPYVNDLRNVVDMEAIRAAGLEAGRRSARRRRRALLGADQRPSTSWTSLSSIRQVDPTFSFMTVDHDGKIRMDCSSPYAMARLVGLKDQYRVAFANDPDSDRHGIVTPSAGLMNPNHYLAVAIRYLLAHRPHWPAQRRDRQDRGQQQHDRPGRPQTGPPPVGGAGRLQMVCAGSVRRLVLLWRRGERRGEFPAARRHACGRPTRTA